MTNFDQWAADLADSIRGKDDDLFLECGGCGKVFTTQDFDYDDIKDLDPEESFWCGGSERCIP